MCCLYVRHSLVVRCLDFCLVSCPLVNMLSGYWANNCSPLVGRNGNEILDGMLGSNLICFQVSCAHSTLSRLCTVADGNIEPTHEGTNLRDPNVLLGALLCIIAQRLVWQMWV